MIDVIANVMWLRKSMFQLGRGLAECDLGKCVTHLCYLLMCHIKMSYEPDGLRSNRKAVHVSLGEFGNKRRRRAEFGVNVDDDNVSVDASTANMEPFVIFDDRTQQFRPAMILR